jgi:hypothetical protein
MAKKDEKPPADDLPPGDDDDGGAEFSDAFTEFSKPDDKRSAPKDAEPPPAGGKSAPEPEPEPEPDPWAGVPKDLRARIEGIESERDKLRNDWKAASSRASKEVSELAKRNSDLERQLKEREKAPPPSAAAAPPSAGGDPTKWAEFKEDYPDIADAMELHWEEQKTALRDELRRERDLDMAPIRKKAEEEFYESEYARLDHDHADWRDVTATDEYNGWLDAQPDSIRALAQSSYAAEVSAALTIYKSANGIPSAPPANPGDRSAERIAAERQARLERSKTVPTRSQTTVRPAAADDFAAAFHGYAQAEEERIRRARGA